MFGNILMIMLIFLCVVMSGGSRAEGDPCSSSRHKCGHGKCVITGKDTFVCACEVMYTGKYCHIATNGCLTCKTKSTTECTGFKDGTAVCICLEYMNKKKVAPSICTFKKARKPERQKDCVIGNYMCPAGQLCVNYAQSRSSSNLVCQCPISITRGSENCAEDYKMDTPGDKSSCVTTKYGPICLCQKYGSFGEKYGFCKVKVVPPQITRPLNGQHTGQNTEQNTKQLTEPLSEGDPCSAGRNKCRHGKCVLRGNNKFVCLCPVMYSGKYCHVATNTCLMCKPEATTKCMSFPDGTAACLCLEYNNNKMGAPSICAFKKKHLPDSKQVDLCASRPCLHDGICKQHPTTTGLDFICLCPLGRKGKTCSEGILDCDSLLCTEKIDCISTPNGELCICIVEHQQEICSVKMRKTTEWAMLYPIEILVAIVLFIVALMVICLLRHCMKVLSQRKKYNEEYVTAVKKGKIPMTPLPDWLDVSNEIIRHTFCCGSSSPPQTFIRKETENKKRDKKKKKDKNEDEHCLKDKEKQNKNDNSQYSKSRHGNEMECYQYKCPNMKPSLNNDMFQKPASRQARPITLLDVANHNTKHIPKTKAECVKVYIDSHQPRFAPNHTSSRGTTQTTAGTARVMQYPQVHESCNPWIKVERHKKVPQVHQSRNISDSKYKTHGREPAAKKSILDDATVGTKAKTYQIPTIPVYPWIKVERHKKYHK